MLSNADGSGVALYDSLRGRGAAACFVGLNDTPHTLVITVMNYYVYYTYLSMLNFLVLDENDNIACITNQQLGYMRFANSVQDSNQT